MPGEKQFPWCHLQSTILIGLVSILARGQLKCRHVPRVFLFPTKGLVLVPRLVPSKAGLAGWAMAHHYSRWVCCNFMYLLFCFWGTIICAHGEGWGLSTASQVLRMLMMSRRLVNISSLGKIAVAMKFLCSPPRKSAACKIYAQEIRCFGNRMPWSRTIYIRGKCLPIWASDWRRYRNCLKELKQ